MTENSAVILDSEKTAAISLVFDPSSPKLVETLGLQFGTYHDVGNAYL